MTSSGLSTSTDLVVFNQPSDTSTSLDLNDTTELDIETARLLTKLWLEDLEDLRASDKGKYRAGTTTDGRYAIDILASELERTLTMSEDMILARSMSEAVNADAECIERLRLEEQAAHDDRAYAAALSRGMALPRKTVSQQAVEDVLLNTK